MMATLRLDGNIAIESRFAASPVVGLHMNPALHSTRHGFVISAAFYCGADKPGKMIVL
jgi:hypothetical protein